MLKCEKRVLSNEKLKGTARIWGRSQESVPRTGLLWCLVKGARKLLG